MLAALHLRRHVRQKRLNARGIRPRAEEPLLRAAQFGGGDHFHGFSNLLGAANAADAPANVA
jgi:arginine/lysine/ornithine decarboxylase